MDSGDKKGSDAPLQNGSSRLADIPIRIADVPISETPCDESGVFALQVIADDMLPEFETGDIVVAEIDGAASHGSFVIARDGEEWVLRQLQERPEGASSAWYLCTLKTPVSEKRIGDLSNIRGVVIQKSKPGRRRTIKRYV